MKMSKSTCYDVAIKLHTSHAADDRSAPATEPRHLSRIMDHGPLEGISCAATDTRDQTRTPILTILTD